jgi:8-oxo-dGTP pyrophosphatase MutT (NUDIX family)
MSQTDKIKKQREQLDSLIKPLNITTTQPSVSLSLDKIKEQSRKLATTIDAFSASLSVEKLRDFTKKKDKSTFNTFQRNSEYARNAFLDLIAPNGNIAEGIYSKAYQEPDKKVHIDNFIKNLKKPDYNVYDWKIIKRDLWDKNIDENDYVDNASKSGILVTDGKREIKVKNYSNQYYSLPEGGINNDETPKEAALREFNEETKINIKDYEDKLEEKCMRWLYTLKLSQEEYDDFIKRFNPTEFMTKTTPEVSGINLEFAKDIKAIAHPDYKQKYLKYKQKYLELKKLLIK